MLTRIGLHRLFFAAVLISSAAMSSERLAIKKGCASCHAGVPGVTIVTEANAPSMAQIAAKYRGKAGVEEQLMKAFPENVNHRTIKVTESDKRRLFEFYLQH
jgi:cytochrome c551/c552